MVIKVHFGIVKVQFRINGKIQGSFFVLSNQDNKDRKIVMIHRNTEEE